MMEGTRGAIEKILFEKRFWILRHLVFWVFMYMPEIASYLLEEEAGFEWDEWIGVLIDAVLTYFHLYFLVPEFLLKRKYLGFIGISLVSFAIALLVSHYVYDFSCDECDVVYSVLISFILTFTLVATAVAAKIFKYSFKNRIQVDELKQMNLQSDLKNLQDQINPHFLFNALNSIYVQAKKGSDKVPEAIMQLSELMRYQTYDSQKDFVKLKDEIEYYRNYLNVESDRRDHMKIGFVVKGKVDHITVAPLIFLPLIENAVKYSQTTNESGSYINVEYNIDEKGVIVFRIVNNKSNFDVNKGKSSGSGLINMNKRLEILYPDYKMDISNFDDKYFCELTLDSNSHVYKN